MSEDEMSRDRSSYLPAKITLYYASFPCGDDADWSTIPSEYHLSSNLEDAGFDDITEAGSGELAVRDTCHAVYDTDPAGADPTNKDKLQSLTDRIAKDFWDWRKLAFDDVFNGVIAPDLDGYTDEITWTYRADRCDTRTKSAPWDSDPETFCHSSPEDDCDARLKVYGAKPAAAIVSHDLKLTKYRLWISDGILKWKKDGTDSVPVCPSG